MVKQSAKNDYDISSKDRPIGGVPIGYLELVHELSLQNELAKPIKKRRKGFGATRNGSNSINDSSIKKQKIDSSSCSCQNEEVSKTKIKKLIPDTDSSSSQSLSSSSSDSKGPAAPLSKIESDSESDEEDVNWEEVEIDNSIPSLTEDVEAEQSKQSDVVIQLGSGNQIKNKQKAKGNHISSLEKHSRKIFHMLDIICILHHVEVRNSWCNDHGLRKRFRTLLPSNTLQELHAPGHLSDTLKSRKFLDGLRHAIYFWYDKFIVTSYGMKMIAWNDILRTDRVIEHKMSKEKFISNLLKMKGNRDLCAQGFCALLRSIDIDCRLVCSLQPMDFTSNVTLEPISTKEPRYDSCPVFWVEAWDRAGEKWVTADPGEYKFVDIVRGKNKLEPSFSDPNNQMRYVVAFEADGVAKDVTRRYASQYNSKTRKKRVTVLDNGEIWWSRVMSMFKRWGTPLQRDIMEDKEFRLRQEQENMPNNVQDFKNHPIYVLEEHLKLSEVLDPKDPCGTLAIRNRKSTIPVYKRSCVKAVKSAQNWFRIGRTIKPGMQPKKRIPKRKKLRRDFEDDLEVGITDDEPDVALYAFDQTEIYIPPPIIDGIVPKNAYGNIDIYVPSMIPDGAVHLPYPNIKIAAKLLSIDFADAVIGFDFNRRRINPRVSGIVISKEYEEAIIVVYEELLQEQRQEEEKIATAKAIARWRRYIIALRIKDRLDRAHGVVTTHSSSTTISPECESDGIEIIGERIVPNVKNIVSNANTESLVPGIMDLSDNYDDNMNSDDGGFLKADTSYEARNVRSSDDVEESGGGFEINKETDDRFTINIKSDDRCIVEDNNDNFSIKVVKENKQGVEHQALVGDVRDDNIDHSLKSDYINKNKSDSSNEFRSNPHKKGISKVAESRCNNSTQNLQNITPNITPIKTSHADVNPKSALVNTAEVEDHLTIKDKSGREISKKENSTTVSTSKKSFPSTTCSELETIYELPLSDKINQTVLAKEDKNDTKSAKSSPDDNNESSDDFFPESMSESELLEGE